MAVKSFALQCLLLISVLKLASAVPLAPKFLGIRPDLFQGDILQTPYQARNVIIGDRYRWPGGIIKYTFDVAFSKITNGSHIAQTWSYMYIIYWLKYIYWNYLAEAERAVILSSMNEISSKSCVKFVERTANELDFVNIVKGLPGSGCNSYVGRIGGAQVKFKICIVFEKLELKYLIQIYNINYLTTEIEFGSTWLYQCQGTRSSWTNARRWISPRTRTPG